MIRWATRLLCLLPLALTTAVNTHGQYCANGVPVACYRQDPSITYEYYQTLWVRCNDSNGVWDDYNCTCNGRCALSPIIIDLRGDGFALTSAADGVAFDIDGNGKPEQISWTAADGDDAFLVLDRNNNGTIDNGQELFGNYTPQPATLNQNGFTALALYDKRENGGNEDGVIDRQDAIYTKLRLWIDVNHNGVSERTELFPLAYLGVQSISLDYKKARRIDEHGNVFWYRARVNERMHSAVGTWAYDILFTKVPDTSDVRNPSIANTWK